MSSELSDPTPDQPSGAVDVDAPGAPDAGVPERQPDWWHRDHPTFTALSGFFTGLAFVILVPGTFAAVLSAMFDQDTVEDLFSLVLITLAVPLGLVVAKRTRRFGTYLWIGMVLTAIVVVGVAAVVLWLMVTYDL